MGVTLSDSLVRKDPSPQHCGRQKCLPCVTAPGKCTRPGVIYRMTCNLCREDEVEEPQVGVYIGESDRTAYDRRAEHHSALVHRDKESPLVEHSLEVHGDRT